jgi:hypothetical protein
MSSFVRNFLVVGLTAGGVALSVTFWPGGVPATITNQTPKQLGGAVSTTPISGCSTKNVPLTNADVGQLINNYRLSQGLRIIPVDTTGKLAVIAADRVFDMQQFGYVGVINTSSQDISMELTADGIPFFVAGLNVFKGCIGTPPDNAVALNDWLANASTLDALNYPNWTGMSFSETMVTTDTTNVTGYFLIAVVFVQQ